MELPVLMDPLKDWEFSFRVFTVIIADFVFVVVGLMLVVTGFLQGHKSVDDLVYALRS